MPSWRERIVAARARGGFTIDDKTAAGSWPTCAVGEQHAALPDVVVYEPSTFSASGVVPTDDVLTRLGSGHRDGFCGAVLCDDATLAETLLDAIEDRVLALKREAHGVTA